MTKVRLRTGAITVSTVMLASLLSVTSASAANSEADDVVSILESVPTEIPIMEDVVTDGATDLVAPGTASSDLAAIEDVTDVSVSDSGKNPLSVELIAAQNAVLVSVSNDGVEVIDNGDGSSTVPLERADGSLQVVFVIADSEAPTGYAIDIDLPEGVVLTEDEGGALLATAPDGRLALGVAPAWAYDAAGTAVPTRYVVEGSEISQIVDHTSGAYQYPISADPWLGQRLFNPMILNRGGTYNGQNRYTGTLTPWGVAMGIGPGGFAIMSSAGMEEFTSTWVAVANSVSLQQQYQCHAAWGRAILGSGFHWDLEASRPTNANFMDVLAHECNW